MSPKEQSSSSPPEVHPQQSCSEPHNQSALDYGDHRTICANCRNILIPDCIDEGNGFVLGAFLFAIGVFGIFTLNDYLIVLGVTLCIYAISSMRNIRNAWLCLACGTHVSRI